MWLAVLKHSWCFTPHKLNGASSKILCRETEKQGILHIHLSNSFSSAYQVHGQDGRRAGAYVLMWEKQVDGGQASEQGYVSNTHK